MVVESGHFLTLEAGHASPHDFVDKEEVGGDNGAAVDHLLLDSEVEFYTEAKVEGFLQQLVT